MIGIFPPPQEQIVACTPLCGIPFASDKRTFTGEKASSAASKRTRSACRILYREALRMFGIIMVSFLKRG
jgi:hypothetical protein